MDKFIFSALLYEVYREILYITYNYDKEKLTQNTEYGVSLGKRVARRITLFKDGSKNREYRRDIKRKEKKDRRGGIDIR